MVQLKSIIFLFTLVGSLLAFSVRTQGEYYQQQQPEVPKLPELKQFHNLSEALHATEQFILSLKEQLGIPSVVFGFAVRGKPILEKAWGYADLENSVPVNVDTKYRLASVTKTFTSALTGNLVDRGLVQYSDNVDLYVSHQDFPPKSWKGKPVNITIGQLLSHTAGLHATQIEDFSTVVAVLNCTQGAHKYKDLPLTFEPGTSYTYSNFGYILLGAVIESVTGEPFPVAMANFLHKNLKMNSSFVETNGLMVSNRARYYMSPSSHYFVDPFYARRNVTPQFSDNVPTHVLDQQGVTDGNWPAGFVMSTVPDLLHYGQLMIDSYKGKPNSPLLQATIRQMWTPRTAKMSLTQDDLPSGYYCYGWQNTQLDAKAFPGVKHRKFIWHDGGLMGGTTMLILYPEEEAVGVVLTNKGGVTGLDLMVMYAMESVYTFGLESTL